MKARGILLLFAAFCLLGTWDAQAQILKKLKAKVEKKVEDKVMGEEEAPKPDQKSSDEASKDQNDGQSGQAKAESPVSSYKSKFDFVPGEQLLLWEDFQQDAVGDFPALWYTDGSGEVVTVDGMEGNWLMLKGRSKAFIDKLLELPDNFTIQFDLLCSMPFSWYSDVYNIYLEDIKDLDLYRKDQNGGEGSEVFNINYHFWINLHPGKYNPGTYSTKGYGNYSMRSQGAKIELEEIWMPTPEKQLIQVSIWRQGQRLRVYLNENKILDLPKILPPDMKPNLLVFEPYDLEEEDAYFLGNLRIAVGNPDTRNKLLTEGKLVTNGIYFNVNSDKIKPESYGVLKEIASILKDSKAQVKIVGHTDSDGDEKANMELSKRRADAVKKALVDDFGLDAGTLQTEGKGETEPVEQNSSAINKAKNRRVEFIKVG
jgi:outer membrane protein OmpA-like peptidoglycan-associated protein